MNSKKIQNGLLVWSFIASTFSIVMLMAFLWRIYYSDESALDYVTTENVSLLDWGISRVEKSLDGANSPLLKKHKTFVYFENKAIVVSASTAWDLAKDRDTGIVWCRGLINEIRNFFLVDPLSGEPKHGSHSSISVYFQHQFYPAPDDVEQFSKSFDELVKLEAQVHVENEEKVVKCEGPLIGEDIKIVSPQEE